MLRSIGSVLYSSVDTTGKIDRVGLVADMAFEEKSKTANTTKLSFM